MTADVIKEAVEKQIILLHDRSRKTQSATDLNLCTASMRRLICAYAELLKAMKDLPDDMTLKNVAKSIKPLNLLLGEDQTPEE